MGEVPSSGDILSAVVAGLDLRQHMEWKPRTVESRKKKLQRALRNGEDVSSAEMCRVYESIVRAFIGADLLRSATDLSDVDQRMYDADEGGVSFLALLLRWHSVRWDRFRDPRAGGAGRRDFVVRALIDLGIRAVGLRLAAGDSAAVPPTDWRSYLQQGSVLRSIRAEAGLEPGGGVTLERLAELSGVRKPTLDRWLSGTIRPSDERIQALVGAIASVRGYDSSTQAAMLSRLRRHYAICAIAKELRDVIDTDEMARWLTAWHRFVEVLFVLLDEKLKEPARLQISGLMFMWPLEHPLVQQALLSLTPALEADWRSTAAAMVKEKRSTPTGDQDVIFGPRGWRRSASYSLYRLSVFATRQGRHLRATRLAWLAHLVSPDAALYLYKHGLALFSRLLLSGAASRFRRAVEAAPDWDDAHFMLLLTLWGKGDVDEAWEHVESLARSG